MTSFENSKKGDKFLVVHPIDGDYWGHRLGDVVVFIEETISTARFKPTGRERRAFSDYLHIYPQEVIPIPKELENEDIETIKLWAAL